MGDAMDAPDLSCVPLFPLPNAVLFPRAVLPLHIFEPRYREMVADALAGDQRIALALLCDGWQQTYHGRPPIREVVCVGKVIAHQKLEDGRYNLLLQGELRTRVVREDFELSYRRAELAPLVQTGAFDVDLRPKREQLAELIRASQLSRTDLGRELAQVLESPIPTSDIVDICSFSLLEDIEAKQRLLEETDVQRRVEAALRALRELHPPSPSAVHRLGGVNLN